MISALARLVLLGGAAVAAPAQGVWIDVPYVRQTDKACGAATTSMLLRYWAAQGFKVEHAETDVEDLHARLSPKGRKGATGSALERLLTDAGLRVFVFAGDYGDLEKHVAAGRPVAVAIEPPRGGLFHFALVVGLDPETDAVLVNDPARRKLTRYDRKEFIEAWKAARSWTLLGVPADAP